MTTNHFNNLSEEQAESLALLAEECAEVIVAIQKIMRHGLESCHPNTPSFTNRNALENEIGDVLASIRMARNNVGLDDATINRSQRAKHLNVEAWVHHMDTRS